MAAISGSTDHQDTTTNRLLSAWREQGTPTVLTAAVTLLLSATLGAWWIGVVVAGLFVAGTIMVALEGRRLRVDEFAAISTLHAAAAVVLSLSV